MKSIQQVISEIDSYKIYNEMVNLVKQIPTNGIINGELASILQTKCWLIIGKANKLASDLEEATVKLDVQLKNVLSDKKSISEEKSEAGKEREAKACKEYQELYEEFKVTEVAKNKVVNQVAWFNGGVFVMRSRQTKENREWQSTPTTETK